MRWWGQPLVIAALACTASLIFVLAIGGDSVLETALGCVAIPLWVVIIIVYLKVGASEEKELYRNALSLVEVSLRSDEEYMQIVLKLSKVHDRPIEYKVDLDNSYTKIDGNRQQQMESGMSASQTVGKEKSEYHLPRFKLPKSFPCNAIVHYEILCGPPQGPIYRQIRQLNVHIDYNSKDSQFEIKHWVIAPGR